MEILVCSKLRWFEVFDDEKKMVIASEHLVFLYSRLLLE